MEEKKYSSDHGGGERKVVDFYGKIDKPKCLKKKRKPLPCQR